MNACASARVERSCHAVEHVAGAGDEPGVDEGQQELGVVAFQVREVVQFTHLVAHHHAGVPQRVQQGAQERLVRLADAAAEEHQQVEVRVQAQVPAAVAADRHDGDRTGRAGRLGHQAAQQRVDAVRVALERVAAAGAALDVGAKLGAGALEGRNGGRARRPWPGHARGAPREPGRREPR